MPRSVVTDAPRSVAAEIARLRRPLLIATDVDGTLSPLVSRPEDARLLPGAVDVLRRLAGASDVHVAVVSGRTREQLVGHFGIPETLHLVASHGAEHDGRIDPLSPDERRRLSALEHSFADLVASHPGTLLEHKAYAVSLHARTAEPEVGAAAMARATAAAMEVDGVTLLPGHLVVEASVRRVTKATALARLRAELGAAAVMFVGDDASDETAFATFGDGDLGVRVGPGETAASRRLAGPVEVLDMFTAVADLLVA